MYARTRFDMGSKEGVMVPDVAVQKQVGSAERYLYVIVGIRWPNAARWRSDARSATGWTCCGRGGRRAGGRDGAVEGSSTVRKVEIKQD